MFVEKSTRLISVLRSDHNVGRSEIMRMFIKTRSKCKGQRISRHYPDYASRYRRWVQTGPRRGRRKLQLLHNHHVLSARSDTVRSRAAAEARGETSVASDILCDPLFYTSNKADLAQLPAALTLSVTSPSILCLCNCKTRVIRQKIEGDLADGVSAAGS